MVQLFGGFRHAMLDAFLDLGANKGLPASLSLSAFVDHYVARFRTLAPLLASVAEL